MSESRLSARPMFIFSAAFFLCGIISTDLSLEALISVAVVAVLFLLVIIFTKFGGNVKRIAVPLLLGVALAVTCVTFSINAERRSALLAVGKTEACEVKITSVRGTTPNFGSYYGTVLSGDVSRGLSVSFTAGDGSLRTGDIIKCTAEFESPSAEDSQRLASERIFLTFTAVGVSDAGNDDSFSLRRFFESINSRLSARLKIYGGGPLSRAVLLGNRDSLELEQKRDFSRLGISHLLAVSGLHLSLVVGIADYVMGKSGVSVKCRSIIKIPLILLYMGVTGFSSSVIRAGIMHIIKASADFVDRRNDPLTALGTAVVLITIFDPYSFYDVGLILSALSAYACITFGFMQKSRAKNADGFGVIRKVLRGCLITSTLTVWITLNTLPITVRYFGSISLLSPLSNVIYIPAVTLLLCLAAVHLILCKIPLLGTASSFLLANTEKLITCSSSKLSHIPSITVSLNGITVLILAILLFVCIAEFPIVAEKRKKLLRVSGLVLVSAIVMFVGYVTVTRSQTESAVYVTNGKNEGFIIRDGLDYIIIDVSDGSKKMLYNMYELASEASASEIETLVLTHLHSKHTASVDDLTGRMIVRRVLLPEGENDDSRDIYGKLLEICRVKGIEVVSYKLCHGETFSDGDFSIAFHNYTKLSRSTHPVISFEFSLDGQNYLYGGASRSESDDFIAASTLADTVFIGNHPPKTKTNHLPPIKSAVVSAGEISDELKEILKNTETVYLSENTAYTFYEKAKEK